MLAGILAFSRTVLQGCLDVKIYNKQHRWWGVASLCEKRKWKMSWAFESSNKTLLGSSCILYKISPICRVVTSMGALVGPWWQDCRFYSAISWASNSPRAFVVKCWRMLYREYTLVKKGTWKMYWQFAESVCVRALCATAWGNKW